MDKTAAEIASLVATTPEQRAREIENERRAEERLERKQQVNMALAGMDASMQQTVALHLSRLGRRGRLKHSDGAYIYRPEWDTSETADTTNRLRAHVERAAYYMNRIFEV